MRPLGGAGPVALAVLLVVSGVGFAVAGAAPGPLARAGSALGVTLTANPVSGYAPLSVDFTLTVPANTTPPAVSWSFGDGQYLNGTGSAVMTPVHVFLASGDFRTVATATWPSGPLNASLTIVVAPANLTVAIHANVSSGTAPLNVEFSSTAAGGTGTFVSYLWSFGDGRSGSGPSIRYTFDLPGHYAVALTVTDGRGDAGAATSWVNVSAAPSSNGSNSTDPSKNATPTVGSRSGGGPWNRIFASGVFLPSLGVTLTVVALVLYLGIRGRAARARTSGPAAPPALATESALAPSAAGAGVDERERPPAGAMAGTPTVSTPPDVPLSAPGLPAGLTQERQIANRTIRLLAELPRFAPGDVPGPERTQAGIVAALGAGQSAVSRVLGQLERAGVVSVESTRVVGSARQVKVYRLTPRGERLGFALRESGPRK
jgi:PKD domain-containing protein